MRTGSVVIFPETAAAATPLSAKVRAFTIMTRAYGLVSTPYGGRTATRPATVCRRESYYARLRRLPGSGVGARRSFVSRLLVVGLRWTVT